MVGDKVIATMGKEVYQGTVVAFGVMDFEFHSGTPVKGYAAVIKGDNGSFRVYPVECLKEVPKETRREIVSRLWKRIPLIPWN